MRICGDCGQNKPLDQFYNDRSKATGKSGYCGECLRRRRKEYVEKNRDKARQGTRDWYWKNREYRKEYRRGQTLKKYGIDLEIYEALLTEQGGCCAICKVSSGDKRWGTLYVDHDHVTGRPRGLLCNRCNFALGQLDDDTDRMERMIDYVRRYRLRSVESESKEG